MDDGWRYYRRYRDILLHGLGEREGGGLHGSQQHFRGDAGGGPGELQAMDGWVGEVSVVVT